MDAYETRRKSWEDLEVTKEELKNLTECLKKEEFRKLLIEYADEVTDPENRKTYEKEITELEKERGVDVTFINPKPGYVIKTSVDGERKCFINICKSDIVEKPSNQPSFEEGQRGLQWSIPYTLIPPREDLDKKNVRCLVCDVIFHPDTIYLTSKNAQFRDIVNNTAMDGVESNFKVKLDRKNLRFPKMVYKGVSHPAVIRKPSKEPPKERLDIEPEIYQKLMSSYDENRERHLKRAETKPERDPPPSTYFKGKNNVTTDKDTKYATPKFLIKHQSDVELADFCTDKDAKMHAAIPKKLVISIDLPLLKTASDATLDVQERFLTLKSEKPTKYLLELPLPYCVDSDNGNAKFDPKYKKLTITLPVIRSMAAVLDPKEDSGVESDHSSPVPLISYDSNCGSTSAAKLYENTTNLIEECQTADEVSRNESESIVECADNEIRTSSINDVDTFMNPNVKYSLPAFTCNIYENQLAITVNVKNVDRKSIEHRFLENNLGLHILLASIGAGLFPQYYSLCLKMRENSIEPDSLTIDPWDNNVVFTIVLKNVKNLSRYYVGTKDEFMEEKYFPTIESFKDQLKELTASRTVEAEEDRSIDIVKSIDDNSLDINISESQLDSDDESEQQKSSRTLHRQNRRLFPKSRSVSESSGDELASSSNSTNGYSKGILKSRRAHCFARSVSESSADETSMPASSVDYNYNSVQDFNSESDCSSLKKTVRFNDVVSRQLFRSNSSILGQRKKNQRKLRNKKRSHERRMSESENSETEERDKYKTNPKTRTDQDASETVKPILNRDKQSSRQRTADIDIAIKGHVKSKKSRENRGSDKSEEETAKNVPADIPSDATVEAVKAEFKNDLIFDLDM